MHTETVANALNTKARSDQRGAALLTVLFVSTLLVMVGGALILVTGTGNRTAIDSTAEMQAYYSAEAGLQASLNVLRGNVSPQPGMPGSTKINFRNANTPSSSNLPGDSTGSPRLSGWLNYNYTPSGAPNPDRVTLTGGYTALTGLAYSVGVSDPDGTPLPDEPARLLLRVTGYGPKGAIKRLELVVKRTNFDYNPPAMLMMRGKKDCSDLTFTIGDSNAKDYTGQDHNGTSTLPAFGATCGGNETNEQDAITKGATVGNPKTQTFADPALPAWLQTADLARSFLYDPIDGQMANAIKQNRYFTSFDGYAGSDANPALTFVDGDCTLDGGAGLLIVTGHLEMNGNPNFNGLILVLGDGTVNRDGAGNGTVYGAMAVARFDRVGPGDFLAPTFTTNGAGNSTMQFDSTALRKALNIAGPRVMGVHEY